ncbi:MAG: DUF2934 domain-containing protein [Planctomycetota bacterium]
MAKTSRKIESSSIGQKTPSASENESSVGLSSPESPRTADKVVSVGKTKTASSLTHQQIEQRANEIWRQKGCPAGQEEKNWHEAEAQLKRELGIR